jgi:hypothetical protein
MKRTFIGLLLALSFIVQATAAQHLPKDAPVLNSARVPFRDATGNNAPALVERVSAMRIAGSGE